MATILVADDEAGVREMLRWVLADRGYEVVTARDSTEALAALDSREFDLVLADVSMRPRMEGGGPASTPGIDGNEVLQTSKQISPDTEVVIATAEGDPNPFEWVRRGAFDFIQKPFKITELVATVERALERRQLRAASALYQASRVILDTREPNMLPQVIVGVALKAMSADDVVLLLPGSDDKLYSACSIALTESIRHEVQSTLGSLIAQRAPGLREPVLESHGNVHSCIIFPLTVADRLVGVLAISRVVNPRPFRKLDVEKASVLGAQIMLALENMRLVRQTIAAERLATVGQVATSIAHEVNNPIAYVLASQSFLREQIGQVVKLCSMISTGADAGELRAAFERIGGATFIDELVQSAEDVREGAARVRDILRDTRALAHHHDLEPVPFDINEAIRSALRVVAAEIRHKAEVGVKLAEGLSVQGNAGRMSQVFVNLLVNAGEAFGAGSCNTIEVQSKKIGNHVVVTVRDNGPGIAADHLPRIFDQFFTTKSTTSATGLGLPISRDIVRSYGGEIAVESTTGGTTFSIVLPQSSVIRSVPPQTSPPPFSTGNNHQLRLLFIDDEPNILCSYKRAFGKTHLVMLAKDGHEALTLLRERGDYDLVVCDLSMPGMSGMQFFEVVQREFPALADRIVFATGGATQRNIEEFLGSVSNRVLEKPFDLKVLRDLLAELMLVS